ncbi:MAG: TonB-dependent receptor [Alphaproteobacteria bacterium GM202ARS2]|nr:TonB-dependent receptor [Alphaproteobacteria bacterium GM202ARS2]
MSRILLLLCAFSVIPVRAQAEDAAPLPDIYVIAPTPVAGSGLPLEETARSVHVIPADSDSGNNLVDTIHARISSLTINDVQNNPYQKDVQLRGFTASPLLGSPQGLAFYQNGTRINEIFGDVIQWDNIPEFAVHSLQVLPGGDAVFGLNALGGALVMTMKNAFNYPHTYSFSAGGGSFGQTHNVAEYARISSDKKWGVYAGGTYFQEDGWRDFSPTEVTQGYVDLTHRTDRLQWSGNLSWNRSELVGNGPAPESLLMGLGRSAVYTHPDRTENDMIMFSSQANYQANNKLSFQVNAHYRQRQRDTLNGDEYEAGICEDGGNYYLSAEEEEECLEAAEDEDDNPLNDENGNQVMLDSRLRDGNNNVFEVGTDLDSLREALEDRLGVDEFESGDDEVDTDTATIEQIIDDTEFVIGALNTSTTESDDIGFSAQATYEDRFGGRDFSVIGGISFDRGTVDYISGTTLGRLTSTRGVDSLNFNVVTAGQEAEEEEEDEYEAEDEDVPTQLEATQSHFGAFFTSNYHIREDLIANLNGRFNMADVELKDKRGTALNGDHSFSRFNPGASILWRYDPLLSLYGRYAESNRAPTAAELTCADPDAPCRLPNAFLADPPLEQVENRTFEVGMRGSYRGKNPWSWYANAYHSTNRNDIIFVAADIIGTGYFDNVGRTRRIGGEIGIQGRFGAVDYYAHYSHIRAQFRTSFTSPCGGDDDDDGDAEMDDDARTCAASKNDYLPSIPRNSIKAGFMVNFSPKFAVGMESQIASSQYLRGDEANELPAIKGHGILNMKARYAISKSVLLTLDIRNLLDIEYQTFGIVAEPEVPIEGIDGYEEDNRFVGPGAPLSVFVRLKAMF